MVSFKNVGNLGRNIDIFRYDQNSGCLVPGSQHCCVTFLSLKDWPRIAHTQKREYPTDLPADGTLSTSTVSSLLPASVGCW